MLQKVLQSILRRYFGEFITGLQNVELAFWTGKINIQNASFRHQKINQMLKLSNIPLSIRFSYLGALQLDVPWKRLSSAPVEIKLNNVYIVLGLQKLSENPEYEKLQENAKYLLIKNYVSYIFKKSEELKNDAQNQSGFLKKLLIKVLHNVNLHISNIHIRIDTNTNPSKEKMDNGEEDLFYSCVGEENRPSGFSLGFCIESIEADTIDDNNEKKFVKISDQKTPVRKSINLKQISFYWQEQTTVNLFDFSDQKKLAHLKTIIARSQNRLMTIDGTLLMQKNKDNFDYFFSTSFRVLQIKTNYQQLKQIIQVTQAFLNARSKKKLIKMKELKYELQIRLQNEFKSKLNELYHGKFQKVEEETIKLIQSVDKKLLMKWTRDQTIELLKRQKVKMAVQNKNRRSWLNFLSKNSDVPLTEEEIVEIEKDISKFIVLIQNSSDFSAGLYIFIRSFNLLMDHQKHKQKLYFNTEEIQFQFEKKEENWKVGLHVLDAALIYRDLQKWTEVPIFKKSCGNQAKIVRLEVNNTNKEQKLEFQSDSVCFTHEIQFLSFISEMMSLQQREEVKANVVLLNAQALSKRPQQQQPQSPEPVSTKLYDYKVIMKKIQVKVQLDSTTQLYGFIEGLTVGKSHISHKNRNSHSANLINFGVTYISPALSYNIIDNINIEVRLTGLKQLRSDIPSIRVVLNEQSLYSIGSCLQQQYKMLKLRKSEYKNELLQQQQKFMQGQTRIINFLKSLKIYHTILTPDTLLFFQITYDNRHDSSKPSKKISLVNLKITRIDELSFKLQSVMINEIIYCLEKGEVDLWVYHIEQRIYEISSRNQIYNMMEEEENAQSDQPHIYIPYDSTIDLTLHTLEVVYEKNSKNKVISLNLDTLNINLKENNLQFQRKVFLRGLALKDLTLADEPRDEYNTILSNTINYFEDPDSDSQSEPSNKNIEILIEGKKKTHPKYNGQISIKSKFNRLFINYNAQVFYNILYRIVHGDQKAKPYPETIRNAKIIEMLKQILEERPDIPKKYQNAKPFEFDLSFFELDKYRQIYRGTVLFHVELVVEEAEINIVNGNHFWMHKAMLENARLNIDKSTDFMFLKGTARNFSLSDLTGFPKTSKTPFTQADPSPLIWVQPERTEAHAIDLSVGLFEPMTFINKQRFKNYFMMKVSDLGINYQQQPILRFIDFLTNQIILFIMEPFDLHKFDSPERGSYAFGAVNYTEADIKKMLEECVYPSFTHLRIYASNLLVNVSTHPTLPYLPLRLKNVKLTSAPFINNQRVHVRLDALQRYRKQYKTLDQICSHEDYFQRLVSKFQWVTRYLISVEQISSPIFENTFNHQMYFQRANNGDKDLLLPFLLIEKDLVMEGHIKYLNITANKGTYDLINKLFNFNISFDDGCDRYYIWSHHLQALNPANKLIYRLIVSELAYLIPDVSRTVVVIPDCEYKFIREDGVKVMEVNGKCLHVFGSEEENSLIKPIVFTEKNGLEYRITMHPSGDKDMYASLDQIDLEYKHPYIMELIRYFLLDDTCFPKQDSYEDLPFLRCEADIKNSFYRIAQNQEFVYALKGDIKVIWTRNKNTHPEVYKLNKELYPTGNQQQAYDIQLMGVSLRKYNKNLYEHKERNYRALSLPMHCKIKLTHIMKRAGETFYTDMNGYYNLDFVCLKLCYKDVLELQESFADKKEQSVLEGMKEESVIEGMKEERMKQEEQLIQETVKLSYTPQSKHHCVINKLTIEMGLSELPVPLLSLALENSQVKAELLGNTKILTNKLELVIQYWNMLIGRWEPVLEKAFFDLTFRFGKEQYCSCSSSKPILLNLSTESLKVLKIISQDVTEKGNMKTFSRVGKIRGMHVSPYAITNRTGLPIFIHNHLLQQNNLAQSKLKNNDTIHIHNKTLDLSETMNVVRYQIEGDDTEHEIHFDIVSSHQITIAYQRQQFQLVLSVISSPILKEIVISSLYVIYNKTAYAFVMKVDKLQFTVESEKEIAIPFTRELKASTRFEIQFPHLERVKNNSMFQLKDIEHGHEHCIVYSGSHLFNCLVTLEKTHEFKINVSPLTSFVNLLPLDIKMEIALTNPEGDRVTLEEILEVSKEKVLYQFGNKDTVSIRIKFKGFNYSMFHNFHLSFEREGKDTEDNKVIFIDHRGQEGYIMSKVLTKNKKKIVYLYTECLMINESSYPLFIFGQTQQILPGQRIRGIPESQSKFVIVNEEKDIYIGFKEEDNSQNIRYSLQELGNQNLKIPHSDQLFQVVIHSSVHCVEEEQQLFTKIMKITPRFIVQNKCSRTICLRQVNTDQKCYMKVGQLGDWFWQSKDDTRQLIVTAVDNDIDMEEEGWDFSAPLQPESIEETVIVLRPKGISSHKLLIKIEILKELQFTYIIFKELQNPQDSLITFKNHMSLAQLDIHQSFLQNLSPPWSMYKHFSCNPMQEALFGWDYPNEDHIVCVQFNFLEHYRAKYPSNSVLIDLQRLSKPVIIQFKSDQFQILQVQVSLQYVGIRKTVIFQSRDESSASRINEQTMMQQITLSKVGLSLSQIGISLISGKQPRCQIIFISIKKLQLIIHQKQFKRNYQLKLKYINIDNNLYHNTIYPVLFTPLKQQKTLQKSRPFFICLIEQNMKSKKMTEINYFRMAIEPISFKLYDQIVSKLYDMQKELNSICGGERTVGLCEIYRSYVEKLEWMEKQPTEKDKSIFIREIQIGKLTVELSFSIKPTSGGNIVIYTIVTLFKTALSNVSESQIILSRFNQRNVDMGDLTNQLTQFYRKEIFKEIYKIPVSINILGNPNVLFRYLAEGVWEVINQPSEGFIKGPIEGAIGIVKGGVFFARNIVAGTCNSFQVMSQSCSHGISYVTFDEKFITRREKIQMQKSEHIGDGTKHALFALYTGCELAITGLYRHPKEHLEKSGAPGFFKGMLMGITGLVTKPLSGMFEGISKFSEGIKQTALFFQDGPNTTRSRPPRVFIGNQQYYTEYNIEQSRAINLLEFHSTKYLKKIVMLVSVDPSHEDNDVIYLVLTSIYLVILSKLKKKILRQIRVEDINEVQILRPKQVRIVIGGDILMLYTHKYKEFYESFRVVFANLEQMNLNDDDSN